MILARIFIPGFPLLIAALTWWAARESWRGHARSKDGMVIMLAQTAPVLNPFQPATEAERQIIDLMHEPLLRIDDQGALRPVLADFWRWSQEVTCWFADEATAKRAQERMQAQIDGGNRWAEWHLSVARVVKNTLRLSFNETATTGVSQALEVIAELQPQPVTFWRVESQTPLRAAWDRFAAQSKQAGQVLRVWFDGTNACELVLAGSSQRLLDELKSALGSGGANAVALNPLGEALALSEPVLDLDIRPGRVWHDGTPVTAEDARATLEYLRSNDVDVPNHEVIRHLQTVEATNNGTRLHVVFRKRYGPALTVFADLPVLPAAWLRRHPQAHAADFARNAPPGAGSYRIAARGAGELVLVPVQAGQQAARLLFSFAASPLMTEIGMRTRAVDLVWPAADRMPLANLRFTPPRRRAVVLWNTRHAVLQDVRLREALELGTDTTALMRTLPGRLGVVDGSLFAPGLWYSTHAERRTFDLERARHILTEAGWPHDVTGVARSPERSFEFTLLVPGADLLHIRTAAQLVAQWRLLGARVRIEHVTDPVELARRLQTHQFDAALLDQRFEASWDQLPWWHSAQAQPGGTNFCGITDPKADLLLEALAGEFDPSRVPERVQALEARLLALHPLLTLFTIHDEAATVPGLPAAAMADGPVPGWTLRALAMPPKRSAVTPAIDLKLRLQE